jgi:Holliday junction resolvase
MSPIIVGKGAIMKDDYDLKNLRQKPKKKNSRAKGHTFERHIASLLNDRLGTSEFSRTPGSGAFATTHSLPSHLNIYGDLITPIKFRYCIECKKGYNNINLYSLYNNSSEVWDFLHQSDKDSKKSGKVPMMILKQDRKPITAFIPTYKADKIIKGVSYLTIAYKKDSVYEKEWNIYMFTDLLELDEKVWMEGSG